MKKRITVASAKDKGRRLQKWVCEKISDLTGYAWGHDCPIESRGMGQNGVDVRMEKNVLKLFPYSVECKAQEKWSIPAWIEQAQSNIIPGTDWLLFVRRSRTRPIVILDAELFFAILKKQTKGGDT
ncbi:MAG: hypothetical protein EOM59_14215 [Clostridia bacterium]|jgi:hypothetical protein|nr:hypothetical protein [Clostridia bacterium]